MNISKLIQDSGTERVKELSEERSKLIARLVEISDELSQLTLHIDINTAMEEEEDE